MEKEEEVAIILTIIKPIEEIIQSLSDGKYRDADLQFIEDKCNYYSNIACKLMNKREIQKCDMRGCYLNEYHKDRYIKYFRTLLIFFKSI